MKILLMIIVITAIVIGYKISTKLQNKLLEKDEKGIIKNALKRDLNSEDKEYFEKRLEEKERN